MTTDWKLPWEGGCRCGKVRFKVTQPPLLALACHCTGCQSMSASAFALGLSVPTGGFEVSAGDPVIGGLHGEVRHHHCDWCKSWIFTRPPGDLPFVNVRATLLDDHHWFAPYLEIFTSEKLSWAHTGAARSYARLPEVEEFPTLIAEYQNKGAKP
jgi:hypothetical protein